LLGKLADLFKAFKSQLSALGPFGRKCLENVRQGRSEEAASKVVFVRRGK